jgi:uracil-DNA glycosylase family 4
LNARARYLEALGIPRYVLRRSKSPPAGADAAPTWQELERAVADCTRCGLCRGRTRTVFGIGARDASLMVVGEAPGAEEDRQGEPFVGPAGQLLNAMLAAVDLAREATFIANIVKCRPPQNRDPSPEEIAACMPHLARQIALVNPRALLTVGRIAAQTLLRTDLPVGRLRGQVFHYGELRIPLVVTYHPAYLLRTPLAKAKAWEDLCVMRELLARV